MSVKSKIRIGTRASALALTQTDMVCDALSRVNPDLDIEVVPIKTTGDWQPSDGEVRLSESDGGKGLFAKEIERALLDKSIDVAVHSMKDMDSHLPEGLVIKHMLVREDARDAFLSNISQNLHDITEGSVIGTASVRRQAFLLAKRPDLKIVPLRGNVGTRIEKLHAGQVDATLLALAGLKRLGLEHEATSIIEPEDMLPAAGQGAVGIETREDDIQIHAMLDAISDSQTVFCVSAERAALAALDGSCHTPIGAYAIMEEEAIYLRLAVASLDGQQIYTQERRAPVHTIKDAEVMGHTLGMTLKARLPEGFLS